MPSLIVHIGTGKTGSTAIQKHLTQQRDAFGKRRIHYWGLNLENVSSDHQFPWQKPAGIGVLQRMSNEQARKQLSSVLLQGIERLQPDEVAIWSNESIYERPAVYIPLLKEIAGRTGCKLSVIAYARSTRSYTISAYKQWGVKHKTYRGRILGFNEWVKRNQDFLCFGEKLTQWNHAFADEFKLYNYDSITDVTHHFCNELEFGEDLLPDPRRDKEYLSPSDIPLALYALYNNQFEQPVLPVAISRILSRYKLASSSYEIGPLLSLYPSGSDLDSAEDLLSSDTALVNIILNQQQQPPLSSSHKDENNDPSLTEQDISRGVIALLARIIVEQEQRIDNIASELAKKITEETQANYKEKDSREPGLHTARTS